MSRVKSLLTACFAPGEHTLLRQSPSKRGAAQNKVQLETQCADFNSISCLDNEVGEELLTRARSTQSSPNETSSSVATSGPSSISYLAADDTRASKRTGVTVRISETRSHQLSRKHSTAVASTTCTVSVQSLAVGMNEAVTMASSSDTNVKGGAMATFQGGPLSPFHSAAAVPFGSRDRREDLVVVITNTTHTTPASAGGGNLNRSAEQSAATPFDFCASVTSTRHASLASSIATAVGLCAKLGRHDSTFSPYHRNYHQQHHNHRNYHQQHHNHHNYHQHSSHPSHAYPLLTSQPSGSAFTCNPVPLLDSSCTTATPSLPHAGSVPLSFPQLLTSSGAVGNAFRSLSGYSGDILGSGSDMPTLPIGAMCDITTHAMLLPSRTGSGATEVSPPSLLLPVQTFPHLPPPRLHLSPENTPTSPFRSGSIALSPRMSLPLTAGTAEAKATNNPADKFLRFDDLEKVCTELRDLSFVGSGASGNVYSGTWCGVPVAVKFMLSGDVGQRQRQQREAALSRLASHPHLVQTYAVAAAQLTPEHFHPACSSDPRVSGLSNGDLFSACVAGGTAVDLYGMCCFLPSPSVAAVCPNTLLRPPPAATAVAVHSGASGRASAQGIGSKGGSATFCHSTKLDAPLRNGHSAPGNNSLESAATAATNTSCGGDSGRGMALQKQGSGLRRHLRTHHSVGTESPSVRCLCNYPLISTAVVADDLSSDGSTPSTPLTKLAASAPAGGPRTDSPTCAMKSPSRSGSGSAASGGGEQLQVHAEGSQISSAEIEVDAKADSFVLANQESANGLMLFQPSDVLAHIGARPGDWLTVVIMEEMDRGSLHRCIHRGIFHPSNSSLPKRHRVRGIVRTLVEVAQGMAHLHSSELVHGDLKPANVLLRANSRDARGFIAKVSDFGVTRAADSTAQDTVSTSEWGTVIYTAPEVFNGKAGMPADVFSFGVLSWHLATGQLPHEDINPFAVMLAVSRGELELEWPPTVPRPLRKLGKMCMQHDPAVRPTFPDIVRALLRYEDKMRQYSAEAASAASPMMLGTGAASSQPATPRGGVGGRR